MQENHQNDQEREEGGQEEILKKEKEIFKIPNASETKKTPKKKKIKKLLVCLTIFLLTGFFFFSNQVLVSEQGSSSWFDKIPMFKQLKHLAESANLELKGEKNDRINILLLGMGGKNHDGGYLTDTIMLVSLEPSTKKVAITSIPRDLAIPVENMGWQKINSVNAYAEKENPGSGGLAISQAISDLLNVPIDYYFRVDFAGFINIVDKLGGLKIYVDNDLNDYRYPVSGREDAANFESRYEHLSIEKGWQEMDGTLALKYARSRHALGIEGSDFARAKRQQKIIEAVKDKALSANVLLNPSTLSGLIDEFKEDISTNLKVWEMIKLWQMFKDVNKEDIINKVLDNSPEGLLMDSISDAGAYILSPRSGDFTEIQYFVNNVFSDAPKEIKNKISEENPTVEIRNGTWINGLASQTAVDIEKYGFTVVHIGNSSRQNFQKSVIYDLTYGEKPSSLATLKDKTNANISSGLPQWLIDDISQETGDYSRIKPDFILVIGQDADSTESGTENKENTNQ